MAPHNMFGHRTDATIYLDIAQTRIQSRRRDVSVTEAVRLEPSAFFPPQTTSLYMGVRPDVCTLVCILSYLIFLYRNLRVPSALSTSSLTACTVASLALRHTLRCRPLTVAVRSVGSHLAPRGEEAPPRDGSPLCAPILLSGFLVISCRIIQVSSFANNGWYAFLLSHLAINHTT